MNAIRILLGLCLLALAPVALAAQQPPPQPQAADTLAEPVAPSARGAFLRSLVLPGWGQAYVGAAGRGSVYFALEAGSLWMTVKSWQSLNQARARDVALREAGLLEDDAASGLVRSRERQREDWLTLSLFLLLFSGADAYVAAQLAGFDEHITVEASEARLQLGVSLPLGGAR